MTSETNKPIQTFRLGQVRASIRENTSAEGEPFCKARFECSYRDAEGVWHNTQSFGLKDVLNLIQLAGKTAWYISVTRPKQRKEEAHWLTLCEPEDLQ